MIEEGVKIFDDRKIKFADRFLPIFLASYGCHDFNIINRAKKIFQQHERCPEMRMHILFTGAPGFGRSLYLKQLLDPKYGLVNAGIYAQPEGLHKGDSSIRFVGSCTEARWTGSSMVVGGETLEDIGIAKSHANGIVGIEEFAAIQQMMGTTHSGHIEQALAVSLWGGDVVKDLKGITIQYHTDITLWAANQTMKFNISGGLFRRFFHIFWLPSIAEMEEIRKAVWEGDNIPLDEPRLLTYRKELHVLHSNLKDVTKILWGDDVVDALRDVAPYDQIPFRNFLLGYNIMQDSDVPSVINVHTTPESLETLNHAKRWRKQLLADPIGYQTRRVIGELGGMEKWVSIDKIRDVNLIYSVNHMSTNKVLVRLAAAGDIENSGTQKAVRLIV